jgi:ATP-dependent protease Clp ATPase subunit
MTRPLHCSFCLKPAEQIALIIAGPAYSGGTAYICDECVDVCAQIVAEKRATVPTLAPSFQNAMQAALEPAP